MPKKIYVIRWYLNHFCIDTLDVMYETEKTYVTERMYDKRDVLGKQFRKREENTTYWTTDETKFFEVQQNYANWVIEECKQKLIETQNELNYIIEQAKDLGLTVKE